MTDDKELIARLRGACYLAFDDGTNDFGTAPEAADRIEALTEQLEAARADAKEAEAYAEELEKERDDYAFKLADANNTYSEMHVALNEANDKLAKASETLRLALKYNTAMHRGASEFNKRILATLAEIEGEKG